MYNYVDLSFKLNLFKTVDFSTCLNMAKIKFHARAVDRDTWKNIINTEVRNLQRSERKLKFGGK